MNKNQRDAWNNRPMYVDVFELCDHCNQLVKAVQKRFWSNYAWHADDVRTVDIKSCEPCFDKKVEEAKATVTARPLW